MFKNVMPQNSVFYNLLTSHTDRMVGAANATLRLVTALGNPNVDIHTLIHEVNVNEASADDIKSELIKLLYESFNTPINRDQVHTLTLDIDRVIDSLQSVANSIATNHITNSTDRARQLASLGAEACIHLNRAVVALTSRERVKDIQQQCRHVEQIDSQAEEAKRQAITQLFAVEGDEKAAWLAMRLRGFYSMQAEVLESSKRAARTLEEILMENA